MSGRWGMRKGQRLPGIEAIGVSPITERPVKGRGGGKTELHSKLKALEQELSEDFKRNVGAWERMGIFDEIAAKIDEAIEKLDKEEARL